MSDIRNKINLIALIAALGIAVALVGCVLTVNSYPDTINWLFALIFVVGILGAILNILPRSNKDVAMLNTIIGIICIADAFFTYTVVIDMIGSETIRFDDISIGIWLALGGAVVYTIFSATDYVYKKKDM